MADKVICGTCGKVLQEGDGEVIKKECYDCVIRATPGSPQSRILKPGSQDQFGKDKEVQKPNQIDFSYKWMEADEHNPERRLILSIKEQTYEKRVLFEIGLPRAQLLEFANEMGDIEQEDKESRGTGS